MDVQVGSGIDALTLAAPVESAVPAQLFDKDAEPVEVTELFLIESDTGSEGWALECRVNEDGWGSPLSWTKRESAEEWIRAAEAGAGYMRIVVFTITARIELLYPCAACGEHGHAEADCPEFPPDGALASDTPVAGPGWHA